MASESAALMLRRRLLTLASPSFHDGADIVNLRL